MKNRSKAEPASATKAHASSNMAFLLKHVNYLDSEQIGCGEKLLGLLVFFSNCLLGTVRRVAVRGVQVAETGFEVGDRVLGRLFQTPRLKERKERQIWL